MPRQVRHSYSSYLLVAISCVLTLTGIPGDFTISSSSLTFSISSQQSTLCGVFRTINDAIIETREVFYFTVSPQNPLEQFARGNSYFAVSIYDDDGE